MLPCFDVIVLTIYKQWVKRRRSCFKNMRKYNDDDHKIDIFAGIISLEDNTIGENGKWQPIFKLEIWAQKDPIIRPREASNWFLRGPLLQVGNALVYVKMDVSFFDKSHSPSLLLCCRWLRVEAAEKKRNLGFNVFISIKWSTALKSHGWKEADTEKMLSIYFRFTTSYGTFSNNNHGESIRKWAFSYPHTPTVL